jgi:hypothetical protein
VRVEDVAQLIARVERDEEIAVAERKVARQIRPCGSLRGSASRWPRRRRDRPDRADRHG